VAVLVTDTAIPTVNDEFGLLVASDIPRFANGLTLRVVHRGRALVPGSLNGPTTVMRNNMLIFGGHDSSPNVALSKFQPFGWLVKAVLL